MTKHGGARQAGEGKKIGRPSKPPGEHRKGKQISLQQIDLDRLARLAETWKMSQSAVLRRLIEQASHVCKFTKLTKDQITPELLAGLRRAGQGLLWVDDEMDRWSCSYGFIIEEYGPDGPSGPMFHEIEQCYECGAYRVSQAGDDCFLTTPTPFKPSSGRSWISR